LFKINAYDLVRRDRRTGPGGGVAMFIKQNLNWTRRADLERKSLESMWIEIIVNKSKNFLLTSFYRPPKGSKYLKHDFNEHFNEQLTAASKDSKEIILLGDLNTDYLVNTDNDNVKQSLTLNGFQQHITKPTRITKNSSTLIDIIATNKSNIARTDVIPLSLSDHDMVICIRKQNHTKYKEKYVTSRNYSRYNQNELKTDLKNTDFSTVINSKNVNEAVERFTKIMNDIFNRHAPLVKKRVKGKPTPWLDITLKRHMDRRDKILRKARNTKSETDWNLYKKLRNFCNNRIRSARKNYHRNMLNENRLNARSFWRTIKSIFPTKSKASNFGHSKCTARSFGDFFATAVSKLKKSCFLLTDLVWRTPTFYHLRTNSIFRFQYVSVIFVQKELKALRRNKAAGIDNLPPGLLKDSAEEISQPLAHIINLSLSTTTIPTRWKVAKVTPVHKAGNTNDEMNYRPISVLPVMSKILEKAIHTQLKTYLEQNNLLSNKQFGYRAGRSTETAVTLFLDDIRKEIEKGKLVGAAFMDLSRAFDTLSHATLMSKLKSYGINGNEITCLNDYLFQRRQIIQLENELSPEYPVTTGVPQGSLLGPLLFLVYFNDFPDCLTFAKVIMYADDTVVYFAHKDKSVIEDCLNRDFVNISKYLEESELVINLKKGKTETMLFSTSKKLNAIKEPLKIKYRHTVINNTDTYDYLGNLIDQPINLAKNFEKRYKKASGRIRLLQRVRQYLTTEAAEKVFTMMIAPLLTYCCAVKISLTRTQTSSLTSIENRASRIIYGNESNKRVPSINDQRLVKSCLTVHKCLNNETCSPMKNYFELNRHNLRTRNQNTFLKLPKLKLELGRLLVFKNFLKSHKF